MVAEQDDFYGNLKEVYYSLRMANLLIIENLFIFMAENRIMLPLVFDRLVISLFVFPLINEIGEEPL